MNDLRPRSQQLLQLLRPAAICGAAALLLLAIGVVYWPTSIGLYQFFRSWLFAWVFWLGVSLGSLGIIMMHQMTGGAWGYVIRQFGQTAARCIPVMAVLFIPIIVGAHFVYPWADSLQVRMDAVLQHKARYLNWPFWTSRAVGILAIFSILTWLMQNRILQSATTNSVGALARLRRTSAVGLVIYFILMSFGAVDWIMSREPHWYSTVFGFIVCISQAVSGSCFLILMVWVFIDEEPIKSVIHPNYLNDLGNVLLTFVILWAYLSFAQFLVTWVGNNQNEITWYIRRTDGGWRWVGAFLIAFHFLVPFILLLQKPLKRHPGRLALLAAGIMFAHAIDALYWVTPTDPHPATWGVGSWIYAELMNLLAFIGIGGLWLAAFLWMLRSQPLLPLGDRVPVVPVDHGFGQTPVPGALD